jgi:hypothetical protein
LEERNWDIPFPAQVQKAFSFLESVDFKISNHQIENQLHKLKHAISLERCSAELSEISRIVLDFKSLIEAQNEQHILT